MATNNFFRSDLQNIYNIVQSSFLVYPKEIIISVLKDFFSKDSYYHYAKDEFGFAKTVDHTDLPINAGLYDDSTTRIYIGEYYRFDAIYYPAILVKSGSFKYVPLSAYREGGATIYESTVYEDGYGNQKIINTPKSFLFAGTWEGSVSLDIFTRSLRARDDLAELLAIYFSDIGFETLKKAGVVVKPPDIGAPSESEDRNDKLFRQSITLNIRTEWRREIPVSNIIDTIFFSLDLVNLEDPNSTIDPNFTINTVTSLNDMIINGL